MAKTIYQRSDLLDIKNGKATIEQIAQKYGVSRVAIIEAMSKRKIYLRKKKILITTPYEQRVVNSIEECAKVLEMSRVSIEKALKGKKVPTLDSLDIKVEVYDNG